MAAKKDQAVKNLGKKKTAGRPKRQYATKQELDFAAYYVYSGKPVESAIYAGIPVSPYIYQILRKPAVVAYIEQQRKEMAESAKEEAKAKFELTGEFIDIHVAQRLAKKKLKDSVFVGLAEVAYKSIDRIRPARIVASATAGAALGLQSPAGSSMFQVYKSKWLREKEAEMAQRVQGELASSNPGSTSPA